jgi:alpha-ketoglutarate-dependent taurine dioxygenase
MSVTLPPSPPPPPPPIVSSSRTVSIPGLEPPLHSLWILDNGTPRAEFGQRLVDVLDLNVENPPHILSAKWEKSTEIATDAHTYVATGNCYSRESLQDNDVDLVVEFVDGVTARVPAFLLQSLRVSSSATPTVSSSSLLSTIISLPFEYKNFQEETSSTLTEAYSKLRRLGAVFIRGCPPVIDSIVDVASKFGIIQETNYGQVFQVRSEKKPSNLAFSTAALSLHTDNPYRKPIPGYQCLLCLRPAKVGGVTIFADGFLAAMELQRIHPDSFKVLTNKRVTYRYADDKSQFESSRPVIEIDQMTGLILSIAVNNRSLAPLDPLCPELYKALADFQRLLNDERFGFSVQMEKGDFILWDNFRIVHGRSGYEIDADSSNERHLQGCYLTRDSVLSGAAVHLDRRQVQKN